MSEPAIPADPKLNQAKRLYAEQFGDTHVTNTYLKLAVAGLALALVSLAYSQVRLASVVAGFRPLVLRVDKLGRAEVVRYNDFEYKPQEPEIKYFLGEFCRLYYGRNRVTLDQNLAKALALLSNDMAAQVRSAWRKQEVIANYVRGTQPEIEIQVHGIAIEDLRGEPIRARVDFDQVFLSPTDRSELNRATYTANFAFRFRKDVLTSDILSVNPLGLAIEYFREDLAR